MTNQQSPPLPNFHALSISPYPAPPNDYRYNGVFGPPAQTPQTQGWTSQNLRGSRTGIPTNWYDPPSRESPLPHFEPFRRDVPSPPALSPPSSTTSAPTTSSSNLNPYQPYHAFNPLDPHTFAPMAVTPSPPPMTFGMSTVGSAPNLAGYNPIGMPQFGSQSLASLNPRQNAVWRNGFSSMPLPDDDVIPTAIVIKNIPFAVSRESLLAVIESLGAPLPYAFNYHHDNGIFRGLAFANFRASDEAASVVAALNGYDVQGRKLRVEYKKVLQPGEKDKIEREKALKRMRSIQFDVKDSMPPPLSLPNRNGFENENSPPHSASSGASENLPVALDLNDPVALDIYSRVLVFKEDRMRDDLAFSRNLTPTERRIVHLVAQKLGLMSITEGEGEVKYVVVTREAPPRPNLTASVSASLSSVYLSPYSSTPTDLSPSLRIKKSMPDLRGFNGPVVARDPARSLAPQRSSGNLRDTNREYVSMGAVQGRRANGGLGSGTFNSFFGAPIGDIPPVPPLPSGLHLHPSRSNGALGTSPETANGDVISAPLRNPRGPAGESRGFARTRAGMGINRRVSEEDEEDPLDDLRPRGSVDL